MTGQPLAGQQIVVTRASPQAAPLLHEIEQLGAEAIALPLLRIIDAEDEGAALDRMLADIAPADWLVALSPNGAKRVVARSDRPLGVKIAAIASKTAEVFEDAGWSVDLVADVASSVGLLASFEPVDFAGRVFIAQAEDGRTELADGLRERSVDVDVVVAYRNVMPPSSAEVVSLARDADVVVFASPSAVRRYVDVVGATGQDAVCIGGVTGSTAKEVGFPTTICAEPSPDGIMQALVSRPAGA